MDNSKIFERKAVIWQFKNDCVVVDTDETKLLLNVTVSEIWNMLNGENSVEDLINILTDKYKSAQSAEEISEIVVDSIQMLLDNDLLTEKITDEFDGWIKYE